LGETKPDFEQWSKDESFQLAKTVVYRNGALDGSSDKNEAPTLPADYSVTAKAVAYKQAALAGYRLAKVLEQAVE
jgi:S1/P1 Nuclease